MIRHRIAGATALFLVCSVFLVACESGPSLRADYDKSAAFSSYKTWGFFPELGTNKAGYSSIITKDFQDAIRREMDARGFQYTETNPQLLVNFNANARENVDVRSSPAPTYGGVGYYGYRGG